MILADAPKRPDMGMRAARYLLIATVLALQVSISLTGGLESAVYAAFAWFPSRCASGCGKSCSSARRRRSWYS